MKLQALYFNGYKMLACVRISYSCRQRIGGIFSILRPMQPRRLEGFWFIGREFRNFWEEGFRTLIRYLSKDLICPTRSGWISLLKPPSIATSPPSSRLPYERSFYPCQSHFATMQRLEDSSTPLSVCFWIFTCVKSQNFLTQSISC